MAAYMRSMFCLLSCERNVFLLGASSCRPIVESKRYVRALRRKPVKVFYPEDDEPKVVKQKSAPKQKHEESGKRLKGKDDGFVKDLKMKQMAPTEALVPSTTDEIAGMRIEKAFEGDKRLGKVVSLARSRKFREQQGKILLEGKRLITDALNAGANPQLVFFSNKERLLELPVDKLKRATLVKTKVEEIKIWSDLATPQGVIAIFARPDIPRLQYNRDYSIPLTLICDNIRDPGNLGTMLRCAVAAGCHSVLLTKGCVDPWEPKVLRAGMGAHFRIPLYSNLYWEEIESRLPKPVTIHVADHDHGLEKSMEPEAENLKTSLKAGDYGWVNTRSKIKQEDYEDYDTDSSSDSDSDSDSKYELSIPKVDTRPYFEHWAKNHTALVIGGETHGLSIESVELAEKTAGKRLFIPLVPDVDSLNSAMAASILLFEGRRQLLQHLQSTKQLKPKVINRKNVKL